MVLIFGYCVKVCDRANLQEINISECEIIPDMFPEEIYNLIMSKELLMVCRKCEKALIPEAIHISI